MSRISSTQEVVLACDNPPGPSVPLPFNKNQRPLDLPELLKWNAHSACVRPELVPPNTAQNIFWFGCIDASVSEVHATLTLPGGIITHRNFGNLFQNVDFSAKAALAHAVTQSDKDSVLHVVVVGHTRCRAIELAKCAVDGEPGEPRTNIPNDIREWIKPLIKLVEENPNETIEQLSARNLIIQKQAVKDYLEEKFPTPYGGYVVCSASNDDLSGILH